MKKSRLTRARLPGITLAQGWGIGQTNMDTAGVVSLSVGESADDGNTACKVFRGYGLSRTFRRCVRYWAGFPVPGKRAGLGIGTVVHEISRVRPGTQGTPGRGDHGRATPNQGVEATKSGLRGLSRKSLVRGSWLPGHDGPGTIKVLQIVFPEPLRKSASSHG